MLFDQFQSQEVCYTPDIFNAGVKFFMTGAQSPDFVLADSIDENLTIYHSKTDPCGLINDSNNVHSQCQNDVFDVDLDELLNDDLLNDIDIGELISSSSFPCPSETSMSSSFVEEIRQTSDMIVPASSPTSSISSTTSGSNSRRSKLSPIERKLRKKNQNKTAAEKYRIKKKTERDRLADQHATLRATNSRLKSELENWKSRVDQLKQLLTDVVQVDLTL